MTLTIEEEKELGRRLPDLEARNTLVTENLGLIHWVLNKYFSRWRNNHEDLFQEGVFGLMRACETFDPDRESKFSTYALWWIRSKVQRAATRIEAHTYCVNPRWGNTRGERDKKLIPPVRLNDDDVILEMTHKGPGPEEDAMMGDMRVKLREDLTASAKLVNTPSSPGLAFDVVEARLLSEDYETLEKIAKRHGVTREAVRLVEKKILKRIGL